MTTKNLIGGAWESPDVGTLPVYDPATGEVIDHVPLSGEPEVDRAARAAERAFATWSRMPVMERARLMFRFKELLERSGRGVAASSNIRGCLP